MSPKSTISQELHRGLSVQKLSRQLSKEMGASYKNAERLVRTELNFVQNYAAKESLEAAGLEEYEFIAVLDNRTTPRCQALDGTYHLLEEYSPGTNAPPMHPRCRSTISAIVEGGLRTAKVQGKNIRVPAEMKYKDFKAVYLDKRLTLEEWKGGLKSGRIQGTTSAVKIITPTKAVTDFKTFAQFQKHWSESYNVKVSDELKNLDIKAVKEATQGLEAVIKAFPAAGQMLTEFKVRADERIMSTSYSGQINFNPRYFADLKALEETAQLNAAQSFHPKNTGAKEYGAHEAGHLLELALIQKYGGTFEDWKNNTYARKIVRAAYSAISKVEKVNIVELKSEISTYAVQYGLGETLAEAVADYLANGENAAKLSKTIWQELKRELE